MSLWTNIFRFPKDPDRRKDWIHKIRRENWSPTENTVLCSKHFAQDDFEAPAEHRKKRDLKRTATPSIFNFPDHLLPKQPKLRKPPKERPCPNVQQEEDEPLDHPDTSSIFQSLPEHDYSYASQKVLTDRLTVAEKQFAVVKQKLVAERKKSSFRKKKSENLKSALQTLKKKEILQSTGMEHLQGLLTPTLMQIFRRVEHQKERPSTAQYAPEIRVFASTLQFYSTKAYEYVRKTFSKALPDVSTVRNWFSNIDGSPGVNLNKNLHKGLMIRRFSNAVF
jgi:hypothetical protein